MKNLAAALLMLTSVSSLANVDQSQTIETVYAWQPKKSIDVVFQLDSQGGASGSTVKGSYTMETYDHKKGLEIRFSNMKNEMISEDPRLKGFMGDFMNTVMQQSPAYVIDKQGLLLSLTGMEEFRSNIQAGLEPLMKSAPEQAKPRLQQMVGVMTSEAQLMQGISDEWNRMVGAWAGGEYELNSVYNLEFETPIPALGNMPITMTSEFSYLGKVPCKENEKELNCIKLKAFTHIDEAEGKRFMTAFAQKFNIPNGDKLKVRIDTEIELITEASTLYPHHVVERKTVTMPSPQGEQHKIDTKEYSYSYE